jgi:hypothetical protein
MRYSHKGERGMIRFAVAAVILIVLIGSFGLAQDSTPKLQVFGGYSLLHADTAGLTGSTMDFVLGQPANTFALKTNFNGWSAEAQYNADRWLGLAVDFGGQYGGPITTLGGSKISGLPKGNTYSVLAGPVISYRKKPKITPFVHALFGWDRARLSASTLRSVVSGVYQLQHLHRLYNGPRRRARLQIVTAFCSSDGTVGLVSHQPQFQ